MIDILDSIYLLVHGRVTIRQFVLGVRGRRAVVLRQTIPQTVFLNVRRVARSIRQAVREV